MCHMGNSYQLPPVFILKCDDLKHTLFFGSSSKITVKYIPYIPMYPKNRGFKGRFLLGQLHLLGLQSGDKPALVRESLSNS